MEDVHEFSAGKNDWNTFQVSIDEGRIIVKDETGHIEFEEGDVDQLIQGIDQARRRLREKEREPTARGPRAEAEEPGEAEDPLDRAGEPEGEGEESGSEDVESRE